MPRRYREAGPPKPLALHVSQPCSHADRNARPARRPTRAIATGHASLWKWQAPRASSRTCGASHRRGTSHGQCPSPPCAGPQCAPDRIAWLVDGRAPIDQSTKGALPLIAKARANRPAAVSVIGKRCSRGRSRIPFGSNSNTVRASRSTSCARMRASWAKRWPPRTIARRSVSRNMGEAPSSSSQKARSSSADSTRSPFWFAPRTRLMAATGFCSMQKVSACSAPRANAARR